MGLKYLLLILLLYSCSAEKRCQKHIAKAKAHGCLSVDTVYHTDTIRGWQYDTTFISDTLKDVDTFMLEKNGVEVKTVVKWRERTVTEQVTQSDTIIKYKTTNVNINGHACKLPWWAYVVMILEAMFVLALLYIIIKILKR